MACVNPPLLAKPSRGYGWTCAPCSREHEEEVDSHQVARHLTPVSSKPKSNAPPPRGRGRPRKDRMQAEKEENMEIKHFKMWPFRYFGCGSINRRNFFQFIDLFPVVFVVTGSTQSLKTRWVSTEWRLSVIALAEDGNQPNIDPDDLIFPRAATRVGPKYQVGALPTPSSYVEGPAVPGT